MSNLEEALGEAQEWVADFSATSDEFENLDEGWYPVTVTKAGPGTSQSGNKVVKLTYVVNDDHDDAGRKAFSTLNQDGKAAWKLRKAMKNLGIEVPKGQKNLPLSERLFLDRTVLIHVDDEGWVDDWRPLSKSGGSGLE